MKWFIIITLLIGSFNIHANTSTPRETFRTFLKAMVKVKDKKGNETENYQTAISTLDLSHLDSAVRFDVGIKRTQQLINTLDKIKRVEYAEIPENPDGPIWYFDRRQFADDFLEISVIKKENQWLFSKATLDSLNLYKKALAGKKVAAGVKRLTRFADKVRSQASEFWLKTPLYYENWQVAGILLILLIAFIVEKIAKFVITLILNHSSKIVKASSTDKLAHAVNPLAKIIFVFVAMKLFVLLDFNTGTIAVINRVLLIAMSLMTVWFAHQVIQFFSAYFEHKADKTDTKFDDILVPLLTKTAFVIIYLLGGLLVANSLTIDVTGIVAGLGIGGLAFAFAAKDTLANFFGSIMLVLDRPFDIGDVIIAGDIEGTVTEVGFRSTRVRTFEDSLITVSNGELMNRPINNKGKRRYRRLVTTYGLEYDTPPEKIEAFCEGIRQLILNYNWTRKDNFHVYFDSYGDFSLNVKVTVYWKTGDYSRELAEKHRLMVDVLRLADEIGVAFAFPTQTVHVFKEAEKAKADKPEQYLEAGIETAKKIVQKPMSLKNPRSNAEDKEQFGDNDIGI